MFRRFPLYIHLRRTFQDIHVMSQHMQARRTHYEMVSRYWLGLGSDKARF